MTDGFLIRSIHDQLLGPIEAGGFTSLDFDALLKYELAKRITPVFEALNATYPGFASLNS